MEEVLMDKIARDYHNNNLVAEVNHFINDDKLKGMLTDHEWLETIADIVNRRKITWGTTGGESPLSFYPFDTSYLSSSARVSAWSRTLFSDPLMRGTLLIG
jgi:hypothetical protein